MQIITRNLDQCGSSQNLKNLILQLEHLMYGDNYQVTLGITLLTSCNNLGDSINKIASIFKDADPDNHHNPNGIKKWSEADFWKEIDLGFNYRGDNVTGLKLSEENEEKLKNLISKYKSWINKYITSKSQFYFYPSDKGIPGYPVFWDYRFIIVNKDNNSLFIYGSSSD
jgi:hypothetical protein